MFDWIAEKKLYIVIALVVIGAIISVAYAISALAFYKPSIFQLEVKEMPITVLSISTNYDPETNRYTSIIVTVRNNGAVQISAKITIYLYSSNTLIANGTSLSFTLNPAQQATIPIMLNWTNNYDLSDCDSGKLVIYPI